jgi:hypothetical protein
MDVVARLQEEIAGRQELDALEEEIATFVARIDQCEHALLTRLREFDARQGWVGRSTSCARWLSWWTGLSMQAARERVRVARALGGLPRIDEAMKRGELSYSKTRALTRVATPQTEPTWIETARRVAADHLEFLCRQRGHQRHRASVPKRIDRRFVRRRDTPHGMVRIEIQLPPAEAEVVWVAIAAATERVAAQSASDVPEAEERGASTGASAEASSETAPRDASAEATSGTAPRDASAQATSDQVETPERPASGEEALRTVRAEIAAAKQARSRPRWRARSPANDASDVEELRAEAVVTVAESFIRFAGPDGGVGPPVTHWAFSRRRGTNGAPLASEHPEPLRRRPSPKGRAPWCVTIALVEVGLHGTQWIAGHGMRRECRRGLSHLHCTR